MSIVHDVDSSRCRGDVCEREEKEEKEEKKDVERVEVRLEENR